MNWLASDKGNLLQPYRPLLGRVKTAVQGCFSHGSSAEITRTSICVFVIQQILLTKGLLQDHSARWVKSSLTLFFCLAALEEAFFNSFGFGSAMRTFQRERFQKNPANSPHFVDQLLTPPPLFTWAKVNNIHIKYFFIHICWPPPLAPYPRLSKFIIFFDIFIY